MFLLLAFIRSGLEKVDLENLNLDKNEIERFWKLVEMLTEQSDKDTNRSEAEKRICEDLQKKLEKNDPEKKKKETSEEILEELLDSLK